MSTDTLPVPKSAPRSQQGLPLPDMDDITAELCKREFFAFVQEFWDVVIQEPPVYNWHIEFLCREVQKVAELVIERKQKAYDLIINVPPGSTKSTICSQMLPAWLWTRDATLRTISASYSGELAVEHATYSREIISSDKYRRLFPDVGLHCSRNKQHNYRSNANGQRFSTSVGGTVTGVHAHILIVDDPLNPKQAASETELKTANSWLTGTLMTRKVDKAITPLILIMQRLAEDDCSGMLLSKREGSGSLRHICLPAEASALISPPEAVDCYVDGLLDPVRLSRAILEENKSDLGSFGYAGQFSQRPVPEEGGILKRLWFKRMDWQTFITRSLTEAGGRVTWHASADLAYTEKEINDPSGLLVWCRLGHDLIIRHAECVRKEQPDLEAWLPEVCGEQGFSEKSALVIEPKANGISTAQNLGRRSDLNVILGKAPTTDKVARCRDISPTIEAGHVHLLPGQWRDGFLNQVTTFPFAKHDEYVDILGIALDRMNTDLGVNSVLDRGEY